MHNIGTRLWRLALILFAVEYRVRYGCLCAVVAGK